MEPARAAAVTAAAAVACGEPARAAVAAAVAAAAVVAAAALAVVAEVVVVVVVAMGVVAVGVVVRGGAGSLTERPGESTESFCSVALPGGAVGVAALERDAAVAPRMRERTLEGAGTAWRRTDRRV